MAVYVQCVWVWNWLLSFWLWHLNPKVVGKISKYQLFWQFYLKYHWKPHGQTWGDTLLALRIRDCFSLAPHVWRKIITVQVEKIVIIILNLKHSSGSFQRKATERENGENCDSEGHLSVLSIRGGTIPQREQELVFPCQSQQAASLAGHTSPSDNPLCLLW